MRYFNNPSWDDYIPDYITDRCDGRIARVKFDGQNVVHTGYLDYFHHADPQEPDFSIYCPSEDRNYKFDVEDIDWVSFPRRVKNPKSKRFDIFADFYGKDN